MHIMDSSQHPNSFLITVKDKANESILLTFDHQIQAIDIINAINTHKQGTVILEDVEHNVFHDSIVIPPCTVFFCVFTPSVKARRRRNVICDTGQQMSLANNECTKESGHIILI